MEENVQEVVDPIIFLSIEGENGDELGISVAEGIDDETAIDLLQQAIDAIKSKF
ncbi:hypothetical protein M5X00_25985 [Paenibacillus alvei]|uniref:hypothetical protein n=1 Tax=Paenibacillus alvei TaxID=44250 RepID=UPI00227F0AD4|nr:hypothetical protein [Paenibacillus alvei]MCY9757681.1 hypothetical protein [Paenibacillus alvei]